MIENWLRLCNMPKLSYTNTNMEDVNTFILERAFFNCLTEFCTVFDFFFKLVIHGSDSKSSSSQHKCVIK